MNFNPQMSQIMNNNQFNNMNAVGQSDLSISYLYGNELQETRGQVISFCFRIRGQDYPVNKVKNNEIFNNVLNLFLNNNPGLKNSLREKQAFMVNGNIIKYNLCLMDNKIRNNSIVLAN